MLLTCRMAETPLAHTVPIEPHIDVHFTLTDGRHSLRENGRHGTGFRRNVASVETPDGSVARPQYDPCETKQPE